jgi:hypothetical protein
MVGFSALTAPFVPSFNRCFEKITSYIVKKNPDVLAPIVNQDLKAIMLNVTATLLVTTAALAYFKMIATVTAVVLRFCFTWSGGLSGKPSFPSTFKKRQRN